MDNKKIDCFSQKCIQKLSEDEKKNYYVYGLIDPRKKAKSFFYIGKGTENRVFSHERESKDIERENKKLSTIREIEAAGLNVGRVILCSNLTEDEAFAAEAALINAFRYIGKEEMTNIVSGHHSERAYSVEEFERIFGAEELTEDDIKHELLVIKINKLYRPNMSSLDLYNAVRGIWRASLREVKKVQYVLGVYNSLIVAVYKPTEWYRLGEATEKMRDDLRVEKVVLDNTNKNRVFFIDSEFNKEHLSYEDDKNHYLYKSIANFPNQKAQNPITYLKPKK